MEPSGNKGPEQVARADLRAAAEQYRDAPGRLSAHLKAVLDDYDLLHALAADSEFHANGFVKIVIDPAAVIRIRLHVWPRGRRWQVVNPHGHRWAFASWIIAGALRETRYRATTSHGQAYEAWGYTGDVRDEPRLLHACRLTPQDTHERVPGQVYTRDRLEVHDAYPVGAGLVASLVAQGPASDEHTSVYQPPGRSNLSRNSPITAAELKPLLAEVVDLLAPMA